MNNASWLRHEIDIYSNVPTLTHRANMRGPCGASGNVPQAQCISARCEASGFGAEGTTHISPMRSVGITVVNKDLTPQV